MTTRKTCCKCKDDIVGFVAHTDSDGDWCENCLAAHSCDDCGEIQDTPIQDEQGDGLCPYCQK